jgi:Uracil DNA glycosylase superfamily
VEKTVMAKVTVKTTTNTIDALAEKIPVELLLRSGKVFYSGRKAFSEPSALYVLGVNPGGDPSQHEAETIGNHTAAVLNSYPEDWSAYRDESWERATPGTYGMAPRVLHLFAALGLNPGHVPCSNLVFARSRREVDMGFEMKTLADLCWPFHESTIERLRPRAVLCFGKTAGNYVRKKVGANTLHAEFVELNNRRWRSQVFVSGAGLKIVVATHPSIADWSATSTDPTQLIRESLR